LPSNSWNSARCRHFEERNFVLLKRRKKQLDWALQLPWPKLGPYRVSNSYSIGHNLAQILLRSLICGVFRRKSFISAKSLPILNGTFSISKFTIWVVETYFAEYLAKCFQIQGNSRL
jgi:hypothetical protein